MRSTRHSVEHLAGLVLPLIEQGLTYRDIGKRFGLSKGSISGIVSRARTKDEKTMTLDPKKWTPEVVASFREQARSGLFSRRKLCKAFKCGEATLTLAFSELLSDEDREERKHNGAMAQAQLAHEASVASAARRAALAPPCAPWLATKTPEQEAAHKASSMNASLRTQAHSTAEPGSKRTWEAMWPNGAPWLGGAVPAYPKPTTMGLC